MAAFPALASHTGAASLGALSPERFQAKWTSGSPQKTRQFNKLEQVFDSNGTKTAPGSLTAPDAKPAIDGKAKARANAIEFEAVFLHSMFNQMFTGIDGDGPFGGSGGAGVWRSFLSDEYAKSFAKAGGVGLADHVYRALIPQQEASGR